MYQCIPIQFPQADGWTDIQKELDQKFSYSQWFTVIFIFLGHFIFTNLFIGIIIMVNIPLPFQQHVTDVDVKKPVLIAFSLATINYLLHCRNFGAFGCR